MTPQTSSHSQSSECQPFRPPGFGSPAFTLLELLIVITILAALATVATRNLISIGDQTQFDANEALCRDFRRALIGVPNSLQSDNTAMISGLIADLGRPPRAELESYAVGENEVAVSSSGTAYTLRELASLRSSAPFKIYQPDLSTVTATNLHLGAENLPLYDTTNSVPTGWRGPYLINGRDEIIHDAWGKPLAAYSSVNARSLMNYWITSYQNTLASPFSAHLSPFAGMSLSGYHDLGSGFGNHSLEVIGTIIRPGPNAMAAAGNTISFGSFSNNLNAGIVFTNEYVAQLLCTLSFNTNATGDLSFIEPANIVNYYFLAGVIMYGPNPFYNAAATTASYATSRPVGVAVQATGATVSATGISGGPSVNYPNPTAVVFTNYPCRFVNGDPGYSYPLVQGPRVVKPFLLAKRKNTIITGTDTALFVGTARNLTLRPGFNSIQLWVP